MNFYSGAGGASGAAVFHLMRFSVGVDPFHVDYGREDATMESNVSMTQNANGIWYFEAKDLTYHQKAMLRYDVWHKDAYSKAEEHTVNTETDKVTEGSYVTISLNVEKDK
jgi:hypothetical protein